MKYIYIYYTSAVGKLFYINYILHIIPISRYYTYIINYILYIIPRWQGSSPGTSMADPSSFEKG